MRDGALIKVPLALLDDPRAPQRSVVDQGGLDELANSMSRRGLLQPIGVTERDGRYEVVWGHRRLLAARDLGWESIAARLVRRDDQGLLLDRAHENLIRQDLAPMEEAALCQLLLTEASGDIERAARMVGRSVGWVQARLDMLTWPEEVRTAVDAGEISRAAAKPLAAITDDDERGRLLRDAILNGYGERVTRAWYQDWTVHRIVRDPSAVAAAAGRVPTPHQDPTLPCLMCQQTDALGRMQYYWAHGDCIGILERYRPQIEELLFGPDGLAIAGGSADEVARQKFLAGAAGG